MALRILAGFLLPRLALLFSGAGLGADLLIVGSSVADQGAEPRPLLVLGVEKG